MRNISYFTFFNSWFLQTDNSSKNQIRKCIFAPYQSYTFVNLPEPNFQYCYGKNNIHVLLGQIKNVYLHKNLFYRNRFFIDFFVVEYHFSYLFSYLNLYTFRFVFVYISFEILSNDLLYSFTWYLCSQLS